MPIAERPREGNARIVIARTEPGSKLWRWTKITRNGEPVTQSAGTFSTTDYASKAAHREYPGLRRQIVRV